MATANVLWGAPRIHGELLKLGINVSERTVSRYLPDSNCTNVNGFLPGRDIGEGHRRWTWPARAFRGWNQNARPSVTACLLLVGAKSAR